MLDEASVSKDHKFFEIVKNVELTQEDSQPPSKAAAPEHQLVKKLFRLSDSSGLLTFSEVAKGSAVKRSLLTEDDVFILDTGKTVFVYVGGAASVAEGKNALIYAHNYLSKSEHPLLHVTAIKKGQRCAAFEAAF